MTTARGLVAHCYGVLRGNRTGVWYLYNPQMWQELGVADEWFQTMGAAATANGILVGYGTIQGSVDVVQVRPDAVAAIQHRVHGSQIPHAPPPPAFHTPLSLAQTHAPCIRGTQGVSVPSAAFVFGSQNPNRPAERSTNWRISRVNALTASVGMVTMKDCFWTSTTQPGNPYVWCRSSTPRSGGAPAH